MDTDSTALRILALTTSYPKSSQDYRGRFIFEWAQSLQKNGASIKILGPRSQSVAMGVPYEGFRHYPGLLMSDGAPDILQERKIWGSVVGAAVTVEMTRLARSRSKEGDLIVAHWLTPSAFAGLAAQRQKGCPVHAYAHGSDIALLEGLPRLVGRRMARVLDRQLGGISFVSRQLNDRFNRLLDRTPRAPQSVLPMGIQRAQPDLEFAREIRERAEGRPVICTMGRMVPIKGLNVLAEALSLLEPCLWIAAGDGPERSRLRRAIPEESRLFMPGVLSTNMREALFAESCLFVQPSLIMGQRQEGSPVAVIEAMASGLPTILSATGGMIEMGDDAGSVCVPPDDPPALADAIRALLNHRGRRQEISQQHADFAIQFDWAHLGPRHLEVLKRSRDAR